MSGHRNSANVSWYMSTPFENVVFCRNMISFFAGQHTGAYSLNYRPTCRLEARQVLIYQCILDLTGKNDKYNYSKDASLYPPLSYIPCSAKNYKIASALTLLSGTEPLPIGANRIAMAGEKVGLANVRHLTFEAAKCCAKNELCCQIDGTVHFLFPVVYKLRFLFLPSVATKTVQSSMLHSRWLPSR